MIGFFPNEGGRSSPGLSLKPESQVHANRGAKYSPLAAAWGACQNAQTHYLGFRLWLPIPLRNAISRTSAQILLAWKESGCEVAHGAIEWPYMHAGVLKLRATLAICTHTSVKKFPSARSICVLSTTLKGMQSSRLRKAFRIAVLPLVSPKALPACEVSLPEA